MSSVQSTAIQAINICMNNTYRATEHDPSMLFDMPPSVRVIFSNESNRIFIVTKPYNVTTNNFGFTVHC